LDVAGTRCIEANEVSPLIQAIATHTCLSRIERFVIRS
jgi:hypothetical protein